MKILLMYPPSPEHEAALRAAAPGAAFAVARNEAEAAREIADADAVLGNRYFLQSLPHARRLRWMQSNSMGVDRILGAGAGLSQVTLTCARGVYDEEMADHALALVLALLRRLPRFFAQQQQAVWERAALPALGGLRALLLGWGGVAQAAARRLRAFGIAVEGVRRRAPESGETTPEGFRVWGPASWRAALPRADLLLLALPLTRETRHLAGEAELRALPRGAYVVNVGRGGTLEEAALFDLLRRHHLAGAALDVFEEEPLPASHPAWRVPNLLITPHVARSAENASFRWEPLFIENLRRFASGEPLLNVVDREAGY